MIAKTILQAFEDSAGIPSQPPKAIRGYDYGMKFWNWALGGGPK